MIFWYSLLVLNAIIYDMFDLDANFLLHLSFSDYATLNVEELSSLIILLLILLFLMNGFPEEIAAFVSDFSLSSEDEILAFSSGFLLAIVSIFPFGYFSLNAIIFVSDD